MKKASLLILAALACMGAGALDVDKSELRTDPSIRIRFENFEGPPSKIETVDEIRGIGAALGRSPGERSYFGRYRVIRVLGSKTAPGLDADIFVLEKDAAVDHIRNLRLIIEGYLTAAFGYSGKDASTLAEFVTVYNAVYRKNLDYFGSRYRQDVMAHLDAFSAGLARSYREWPGMTRMLIPLREGASGAVETRTISDQAVLGDLRTREDKAVELRKEMVDIKEREIARDEERTAAARESVRKEAASAAEETGKLEREQAEVRAKREALSPEDRSPEAQAERRTLDEKERELAQRKAGLEEDKRDIAAREAEIAAAETRIRETREEVRRERKDIAADQREILSREPDRAAAGIPFIKTASGGGGRLVMIHPRTGEELPDYPQAPVTRRSYRSFGGGIAVILARGGGGRVAILDAGSLAEKVSAREEAYPGSVLEVGGGWLFAVLRDSGVWRLGKYDSALSLLALSRVAVNPETFLLFTDSAVFVEDGDGRVRPLSPATLD